MGHPLYQILHTSYQIGRSFLPRAFPQSLNRSPAKLTLVRLRPADHHTLEAQLAYAPALLAELFNRARVAATRSPTLLLSHPFRTHRIALGRAKRLVLL
jgi:hypothetical protein